MEIVVQLISNVVIIFDGGKQVSLELTELGFSIQYLHDSDFELYHKFVNSPRKWEYITWNYGSDSVSLKVNGNIAFLCPSVDHTKMIITNLNSSKTCDIYDGTGNKVLELELPLFKSPNHPCNRELPKADYFMEPIITKNNETKVNAVYVSNLNFMLEELHVIDIPKGNMTDCIGTQRR